MEGKQKFCKHCGEKIDYDCVVCPKCGKQVEQLKSDDKINIINNNNASSSASASASINRQGAGYRKRPWYLRWLWIFILGAFTGGIYWVVGIILRISWDGKYR